MIASKLKTKNGEIAVYISEPKGLPQLYCIHGGMGLSSDSLFEGLKPLRSIFDLIFIDQRGCGKSDAARDGSYLFSDFASDIEEVVQKTRASDWVGILGHSMGGMIAIETLSKFPDLFQFSILSNTALDDSWRFDAVRAVERFKTKSMTMAIARYGEAPEDNARLRDLAMVYAPLYFRELPDEKARIQMDEFSYRGDAIAFMNKNVFVGMDLRSKAASIQVPTLLISGSMDIIVPTRCQRAIADMVPGSRHITIEGSGHFPFVTSRENFSKQVSQWWEETRRKQ